jgi:hypothetical protein
MAVKVVCPNCGTEMLTSDGAFTTPVTTEQNGIATLVAKEIHNDNIAKATQTIADCTNILREKLGISYDIKPHKQLSAEERLALLKAAGVKIPALQDFIKEHGDKSVEALNALFDEDDPIISELNKGGFINNPELFRRWICAQTMRLLKDKYGWTHAVRKTYDIKYVFNQTKRELALLCKLRRKNPNDIRFQFFTLDDMKSIFCDLMDYNRWYWYRNDTEKKTAIKRQIKCCSAYASLYDVIKNITWKFRSDCSFKPKAWLNCFKGAGAYYTLQNIIRTHGLIIPKCNDMNESLKAVDDVFKSIIAYEPKDRRWDILLSVLTMAVEKTKFELKY